MRDNTNKTPIGIISKKAQKFSLCISYECSHGIEDMRKM